MSAQARHLAQLKVKIRGAYARRREGTATREDLMVISDYERWYWGCQILGADCAASRFLKANGYEIRQLCGSRFLVKGNKSKEIYDYREPILIAHKLGCKLDLTEEQITRLTKECKEGVEWFKKAVAKAEAKRVAC